MESFSIFVVHDILSRPSRESIGREEEKVERRRKEIQKRVLEYYVGKVQHMGTAVM